jgi:hypothetical protein
LSDDKVATLSNLCQNTDRLNISNYELYNLDKITEELTSYLSKLS